MLCFEPLDLITFGRQSEIHSFRQMPMDQTMIRTASRPMKNRWLAITSLQLGWETTLAAPGVETYFHDEGLTRGEVDFQKKHEMDNLRTPTRKWDGSSISLP